MANAAERIRDATLAALEASCAVELADALAALLADLEMRAKDGVVDCSHGVYCTARAALARYGGEQ